MNVLVATDGAMDIDRAADFACALAGDDGSTVVATIVRIPRRLVGELRAQYGDQPPVAVDSDAEYVGSPKGADTFERSYPGDDALVDRYLGDKRTELCKPIVEAIRLRGGTAKAKVVEGDDVEDGILAMAEQREVDVIVVGSRGGSSFGGLLGSTSAKVVRRSPISVLVLR
jgi:nucleotide-binding universal stress UspA family protein